MMLPSWSLKTAAATAKFGQIATSKFASSEPLGGGAQSSEEEENSLQAVILAFTVERMCFRVENGAKLLHEQACS